MGWWLWVFVTVMLHMLCSIDFSHELAQGKCLDDMYFLQVNCMS